MDDRYIILCLLFVFVPINFVVLYLVFSKYDVIVKRWNKPKKKEAPEFSQPAEHWSLDFPEEQLPLAKDLHTWCYYERDEVLVFYNQFSQRFVEFDGDEKEERIRRRKNRIMLDKEKKGDE